MAYFLGHLITNPNKNRRMHKAMYTYGLDRQWATSSFTVKQNYLRFSHLVISLMCSQLWHTVGIHTIVFNMRKYIIVLYTVLLSAINGEILLLPVRVLHVENARTWLPTLWYIAENNVQSYCVLSTLRGCFIATDICNHKSVFPTYKSVFYRHVAKNRK